MSGKVDIKILARNFRELEQITKKLSNDFNEKNKIANTNLSVCASCQKYVNK